MHDDHREEIEVQFPKEDFDKLEQIFLALGYNVKIKWQRRRFVFSWQDIEVMVDYTKGYGYIIELEKMAEESNKEETLEMLKAKLASLGIPLTLKEEFNRQFKFYQDNWRKFLD
jgi:predicted adenylyl cyclase CyaB